MQAHLLAELTNKRGKRSGYGGDMNKIWRFDNLEGLCSVISAMSGKEVSIQKRRLFEATAGSPAYPWSAWTMVHIDAEVC